MDEQGNPEQPVLSTPVRHLIERLKAGGQPTQAELELLLLSAAEAHALIEVVYHKTLPDGYLRQMVRDGRLPPGEPNGWHRRYRLQDLLSIEWRPRGRPRKDQGSP